LGQWLVGERLEHFELQEFVGGGGMGAVFRALDDRLNRIVAVKVLPREQAGDQEVVRRFRNEAQSAARLDHDHIARVYYVGEDKGLHFIAYEFIEGRNLRDLVVERGVLSVSDALNFTLQVADALAHASGRDVVHRDIKPSNLIITQEGRAKLVDMGLARLHQIDRSSEDLTATGVTLGTFDYISPEQARDPRSADTRSDIYSLGCTLFFMLTGQPPFPDGTVLQKLLQHQGDEPPDPQALNPNVQPAVVRLLRKMMAKEPRQRHQTPEELVGDLLVLCDQLGLKPSATTMISGSPVFDRPSGWERHLVWAIPILVLALIVGMLQLANWRTDEMALRLPPSGLPAARPQTVVPIEAKRDAPQTKVATPLTRPAPAVEAPVRPVTPPLVEDDLPPSNAAADLAPSISGPPNPLAARLRQGSEGAAAPRLAGSVSSAPQTAAGVSVVDPASRLAGGVDASNSGSLVTPAPANGEKTSTSALIVEPGGAGANVFPTLQAACAAAGPHDVVELRFDGRLVERPLDLRNSRVTIRPAAGFRPVLVFQPRQSDPQKYARGMISLTGGRLTLINLPVELDLTADVAAESWTLFQVQQAESLQLERCSLTILNAADDGQPLHDRVAFITVSAAPGSGSLMGADAALARSLSIQLRDCVARGEATLLAHRDAQACQFTWTNGLLATTERLLDSSGARALPTAGDQLTLDLAHVTADIRRGLCRVAATIDAPYQLRTEIKCANSILLGRPMATLIMQEGIEPIVELKRRLVWDSDHNFYDGFHHFWEIRGAGDPPKVELPWFSFWRGERSWGRVVWKQLPDAKFPVHQAVVADYALDDTASGNSAVHGATDGRDAGFSASLLPELPAKSAPATGFRSSATPR
jgi:serine/threonine-protein kinase